MIKCERCGLLTKDEETYDCHGRVFCEDCYIYLTNPPKACDPMAGATALSIRKKLGQSGTTGLTELQRQLYNIIEERGKVTTEEMLEIINIKA